MAKIFIDGSSGTTGLRIEERLSCRDDVELIRLQDDQRKDPAARAEAMREADISFLCLPDAAANEAAAFAGPDCVIIDTSTAHRTAPGWVYGFPELTGIREKLRGARRIANPGCHASGFISLIAPLIEQEALRKDSQLICFSVTGYSGGGKKMIADYENAERPEELDAPRQYALGQKHKHLPEMTKLCSLDTPPIFCPVVSDYYSGMVVTVPVFPAQLRCGISGLEEIYRSYYTGKTVRFRSAGDGMISGNCMSGRDDMIVTVAGNEERILLISCFDNLGKGASGAAIQNMNILLGAEETKGLVIPD